jgi:GDP/UDP-N,N'-diacetylbacillosamine 2-epimerase (hydrolysing)
LVFISGSRAESLILSNLVREFNKTNYEISSIVLGEHPLVSNNSNYEDDICKIIEHKINTPDFGEYIDEQKINLIISNIINKLTYLFHTKRPDGIILLGDRYEILGSALAAFQLKIPIMHFHGGEITHGSFDDNYRHLISKCSYYHFVIDNAAKRILLKLGECNNRIYVIGSIALDFKINRQYRNKSLSNIIKKFGSYFIITIHPETNNEALSINLLNLISMLKAFSHILFIITKSNNDPGGAEINQVLQKNICNVKNFKIYDTLGADYIKALDKSNGIIGNSSSGFTEAPALNVPTINIGNRQAGRKPPSSLIQANTVTDIKKAIDCILIGEKIDYKYKPYGRSGASKVVVNILNKLNIPNKISKSYGK